MTTADLLEKWREATRAAELADRLARIATESTERADRGAVAAAEIARMAELAAKAADRAAKTARKASDRAAAFAMENRAGALGDAEQAVTDSRAEETLARDLYHDAERLARERVDQ